MSDPTIDRAEIEALIEIADEKSLRHLARILLDTCLRLDDLLVKSLRSAA